MGRLPMTEQLREAGRVRPLHVVQVSFFNDPMGRRPQELLRAWPTVVDVAEAAALAGARITVIQASTHRGNLSRNGVDYHFLPLHRSALGELMRSHKPDVLHVQGLGFARDVLALAQLAPGIPILLQDHASRPPRWWRRPLWRRGLAAAAGVAFCAREQAQPFAQSGLLHERLRIYEIPESPSRFKPGDQAEARRATGLSGDPGVLWVGHLDKNKDPLTVLEGVSHAVDALPDLHLWCCFGAAPLLPEVRSRIEADPRLRHRVHLLGRVPHERVELLMRAADIFVSGSHRESTGYSPIEAMACGLPPVITDIPSFRTLTGNAAVGALWPCNNACRLTIALQEVAARLKSESRRAVRAHFERELSLEAVGRKLVAAYGELAAGVGHA